MEGRDRSVPMGFAASLRAWAMASRPHTLTISINPVLVGCALAWAEIGRIDIALMVLSALGTLLLQTGTNLDNDVSDAERTWPGRSNPSAVARGRPIRPARSVPRSESLTSLSRLVPV